MMRHIFTVFAILTLAGFAGSRIPQDKPQEAPAADSKVPPEYASKSNPTKPTPAGLEEARRIFGYDCEMCHGKDGSGKGDLAGEMKLDMHDWRSPATLEKYSDGELFYIITKGKGKMVPEGDRVKDEVRWQMVNYVRSLAKKGGAEAAKSKEEAPKPAEEAPKPSPEAAKPPAALR